MGNKTPKYKTEAIDDGSNLYSEITKDNSNNPPPGVIRARALYDYKTEKFNYLTFSKKDIFIILSDTKEPWWYAKHTRTQKMGFIPSNYVVIDDRSPTYLDSWFKIDRTECEKKLLESCYPMGTYIVRPSPHPDCFVLSVLHFNDKYQLYVVYHYLIRTTDDGEYYISNKTIFPDIRTLISYYKDPNRGIPCRLNNPFTKELKLSIQLNKNEVNRDSLRFEVKLAKGAFGEVWKAKWNNNADVAVKILNPVDESQRMSFIDQIKLMIQICHPRIVATLGVCTKYPQMPIYIIRELMKNGALLDFLHADTQRTLSLKTMLCMMAQIADGMSYLESRNVIHRDLRAANILVDNNLSVKITGFSLAKFTSGIYEASPDDTFPIKWTSPEAGLDRIYSLKSDVWSFGILMYEIVTFGDALYPDLQESILDVLKGGYRLPNPHSNSVNCPLNLYNIMISCWDTLPENRPIFSNLKDTLDSYCRSI